MYEFDSIFHEEEIGGFVEDPNDYKSIHNPNGEENYSDDEFENNFNNLGDDYVKVQEFSSIFHEEVIVEAKSSSKTAESLRQVVNRGVDFVKKNDTELRSIKKRIPKLEKLIKELKDEIAYYDTLKRSDQNRRDKSDRNKNRIIAIAITCFGLHMGPLIAVGAKKGADLYKATKTDKSYGDYRAEYNKSELQYALKKTEDALEYLKDRKDELERSKKRGR